MPLIVAILSVLFWLCGILDGTTPTMFISGLIVSWVYLRFYQHHSNGNRGDGSESFTFARYLEIFSCLKISIRAGKPIQIHSYDGKICIFF